MFDTTSVGEIVASASLLSVRAAALLSRFTCIPEAASFLTQEMTLDIILTAFMQLGHRSDDHSMKLREHLTRILAAFCSTCPELQTKLSDPDCMGQMLELLPGPSQLTPRKSTCDPQEHEVVIAHVAKCLISMTERILSNEQCVSTLIDDGALDRMVHCLVELKDGKAKSNVAVALARLIKKPMIREYVEKIRGIEILLSVSRSMK